MNALPRIPDIPKEQRTEAVVALLEITYLLQETIQQLRDEIARLKGEKPKPDIKPSTLEPGARNKEKKDKQEKRPGSAKKSKTKELLIHKTKIIKPEGRIPSGSKFKGYRDYVVQELRIRPHNVKYRLACWQTPEGQTLSGKLPAEVCGHYGSELISYILHQYHHAHVTQPLILEQMFEFGIAISAGQINNIITEGKDQFHAEKDDILKAGLAVSQHVNVDDTGARHKGQNGYCTHIGNEWFAWFQSTESKSRINFLQLLRTGHKDYVVNSDSLQYMKMQGLPEIALAKLAATDKVSSESLTQWEETLQALDITNERQKRIATEGALVGSVLEHGFNRELIILSDDAGQFNVFLHALCWIHAERTINKLIGLDDLRREAIENIRGRIWELYADLKDYKNNPNKEKKVLIEKRFDAIFTSKTCFITLNHALTRLYKNKKELLMVLEHPDIPLHNNLSENDIREYVKKRKISGSTRSDAGRRCRDTFTSLKKTCRKLGLSFWEYLKDRIAGKNAIPRLPDLILERALILH